MSFRAIKPKFLKLRAGVVWGSIDLLLPGGTLLATVWSGCTPPSMEQAEANARALAYGLGVEVRD